MIERRRMRVYVAGPLSSNRFAGVHRGIAAGRRLLLDGLAPFVPHFDAFYHLPPGNWNSFMENDLEYVLTTEAVYRLTGVSQGADIEVQRAVEEGIPVFYQVDARLLGEQDPGYRALLRLAESKGLRGVRQTKDGPEDRST